MELLETQGQVERLDYADPAVVVTKKRVGTKAGGGRTHSDGP